MSFRTEVYGCCGRRAPAGVARCGRDWGSARNLLDVVNHYNTRLRLNLSEREKADLVEFLKSL
jgi:hypothetical protein